MVTMNIIRSELISNLENNCDTNWNKIVIIKITKIRMMVRYHLHYHRNGNEMTSNIAMKFYRLNVNDIIIIITIRRTIINTNEERVVVIC